MGNDSIRMCKSNYKSAQEFKFHDPFPEETDFTSGNGLYFNDTYLPPEIVTLILSHVCPDEILTASLVCRKWCNIIKSTQLWSMLYSRQYKKNAKKLPWYVYYCYFTSNCFDRNLLLNGNGEREFEHWKIVKNYGDEFKIEDPPQGTDPLPANVPDFNGHTSCFATSYYECNKLQYVTFEDNHLLQLILNVFKPTIYASEWVAGRFDSSCIYTLSVSLTGQRILHGEVLELEQRQKEVRIKQWEGHDWQKIEIIFDDYANDVITTIVFQHEGRDTQFWKGHYGSKMAGGVVKILFDTIEPVKSSHS